jgi:GT2 family glycosyltransferase
VVVDNASTDGTVEAVRAEFADVKIIENTTNLRYAGGNNKGIQYALDQDTGAILLLNNDTIVDPEFLTLLIETLMADPTNGIVGPMIYYHADPQRIWYAGGRISWWQGWISHRGIREIDSGQYATPAATDYVTGCCILVQRNVITQIGMLDDSYFIYGEDTDWCLRALQAGYRIMIQPGAHVWHKVSASSGQFSWYKNSNKFKSQFRLLARYARWYHWITIPWGFVWNLFRSFLAIGG